MRSHIRTYVHVLLNDILLNIRMRACMHTYIHIHAYIQFEQQKVAAKEIEPNAEQTEKLAKRGELEAEIKALEKELAAL